MQRHKILFFTRFFLKEAAHQEEAGASHFYWLQQIPPWREPDFINSYQWVLIWALDSKQNWGQYLLRREHLNIHANISSVWKTQRLFWMLLFKYSHRCRQRQMLPFRVKTAFFQSIGITFAGTANLSVWKSYIFSVLNSFSIIWKLVDLPFISRILKPPVSL